MLCYYIFSQMFTFDLLYMQEITPQDFNEMKKEIHDMHRMMKQMNRKGRMQNVGKIVKSLVVLAVIITAFVILRPYLQQAKEIYSSVSENLVKIQETSSNIEDKGNAAQDFLEGVTGDVEGSFDGLKNFFNGGSAAETTEE
jgi:cytoskeletal protein RodZ